MAWRSVVITRPSRLTLKHQALVVEQDDGKAQIPLEDMAVLLIENPQVKLTAQVLSECAARQIAVITVGDNHHPNGVLLAHLPHSRALKVMRAQLEMSQPTLKQLWQTIIRQKIRNQAGVLANRGHEIAYRRLEALAKDVRSGDSGMAEAQASQLYFPALFGKGFSRKQERFHNAALNYGYTIVRAALARSLVAYGFLTDYVWLLNNDAVVNPDTLDKLIVEAEKSPDIGLVSPVIYYYDEPEKIQFCGSYINWASFRITNARDIAAWREINGNQFFSLWGTALLIKSSVIKKIGYLNPKYFAYYEDCEYFLRAARATYKIILEPTAKVYHKISRSTGNPIAPLQVFLRVRNLYFLWMDNLRGIDKAYYFKKYLGYAISYGGSLRKEKLDTTADACLDGAWAAIRKIGGPWDKTAKMPASLKKIFWFLSSWHPYFWAQTARVPRGHGRQRALVRRITMAPTPEVLRGRPPRGHPPPDDSHHAAAPRIVDQRLGLAPSAHVVVLGANRRQHRTRREQSLAEPEAPCDPCKETSIDHIHLALRVCSNDFT